MRSVNDQLPEDFNQGADKSIDSPLDNAIASDYSRYSRYGQGNHYKASAELRNEMPVQSGATPSADSLEEVDDALPRGGHARRGGSDIDSLHEERHAEAQARLQAREDEAIEAYRNAQNKPLNSHQTGSNNPRLRHARGNDTAALPASTQQGEGKSTDQKAPVAAVYGAAGVGLASAASPNSRQTRSGRRRKTDSLKSAADPYNQSDAYVQKARDNKRRRRRIGVIVGACVLALVLIGAGVALVFINSVNANLSRNVSQETLNVLEASEPGDPFYMLLMGTDGSTERRNSEEYAGDNFRCDSMMLLRIDPKNKKVACVSLIRDTKMDFGSYGIQKLNAAHAIGGTDYTIKTISQLAGVPITHYAILDFDGFKEVVDALGGVEVDVKMEIDDPMAGGHLDEGLQTLNGEQALILCRSRHAYDDIGDGDRYRAANQRAVISAIGKKVLSSDVGTMLTTVEKLSNYVETDMTVQDIVALGSSMRGINMDTDFYTAIMPTEPLYSDGVWWEILDKDAWRTMMNRINQGLSPTEENIIDPYTGIVIANSGTANSTDESAGTQTATYSGTVAVRNGCGRSGVAAEAAEKIEALGFSTDASNANSSDFTETVIVYDTSSQKTRAEAIASALGVGTVVRNDNTYIFDTDILVVIGADWPQSTG